MKKILLFLILFPMIVFAQAFTLTANNFINTVNNDDFIVLEFTDKPKNELFNLTKEFINTYYNNPKFVTSESEKDQLVVNAFGKNYSMTMFKWYNEYQYELLFKDGKIKFTPKFKWIKNFNGGNDIPLVLAPGYIWAVFNTKGKIMRSKAKDIADQDVNDFIKSLKNKIESKEEW